MRKSLVVLLLLFTISSFSWAQFVFEPFEEDPDSNYVVTYAGVDSLSRIVLSQEAGLVHQGSTALGFDWRARASESWGGFAKIEMHHPDSMGVFDFSAFDSLSFWYYIERPSSTPGDGIHFRLQFFDVSDTSPNTYDGTQTELWYSFHYILDATPGWHEITMAMEDVGGDAQNGSNGFWRTGWSGITGNDYLDLDMIKGLGFEISVPGPQTFQVDSGNVIFDYITLKGPAKLDVVFFSGKAYGSGMSPFQWSGSQSVVPDSGYTPNTPAVMWQQDPGQAWTGFGWDFPAKFLKYRWPLDSLKFYMKAPSGLGTLRAQFEDGTDKVGINFSPIDDGAWHHYALPLRDFVYFDGSTTFDTSAVTVFQFLAEGTGNGHTVYWDNIWTGNPPIDNIDPDTVTNVSAIPDVGNFNNLVIWTDVPDETGESYTVFASPNPIPNDLSDPLIEVVATGVAEGAQNSVHYLQYPLNDTPVDYYYAVICTDAAGNEGAPGLSPTSYTNTALGVPTISLNVPSNFVADGDLTEWTNSSIMPWVLMPSTNTVIGAFGNDDDLTATVYVAMDQDFLYVAADVIDDVYNFGAGNWWDQDALQFFIGLYDHRGPRHSAYQRGSEPDYGIVFNENEIFREPGPTTMLVPTDPDYHFDGLNPDYIFEAKISLDSIKTDEDDRFYPENGMKIAMDIYFHDNDGVWDGNLAWSQFNTDQGWNNPREWHYSWIGDIPYTGVENELDDVARSFKLNQNYPNPFNPVTTIEYTIPKSEKVKIDIYNVLGQNVQTLINQTQNAGSHVVSFDATNFSSGVYFYRIEAGQNVQTKKMILMK